MFSKCLLSYARTFHQELAATFYAHVLPHSLTERQRGCVITRLLDYERVLQPARPSSSLHIMDALQKGLQSLKRLSSQRSSASMGNSSSSEDAPPPYTFAGTSVSPEKAQQCRQGALGSAIENLPAPLDTIITDYLDPLSFQCLRLTNRWFYHLPTVNEDLLTPCAKWLIMARLEQDLIDSHPAHPPAASPPVQSPRQPKQIVRQTAHGRVTLHATPTKAKSGEGFSHKDPPPLLGQLPKGLERLTCALCKTKHGPSAFTTGTYVICIPYPLDPIPLLCRHQVIYVIC